MPAFLVTGLALFDGPGVSSIITQLATVCRGLSKWLAMYMYVCKVKVSDLTRVSKWILKTRGEAEGFKIH